MFFARGGGTFWARGNADFRPQARKHGFRISGARFDTVQYHFVVRAGPRSGPVIVDYKEGQINMRKTKLSIVAAAALVGATAQFGVASTASASSSTITIPMPATPAISTLDPSNWGAQILIDQGTVMEGLFGYSATGQIVPKIASSYTVSDGGRVWTFFLRHDAKWSNGQPVTAQDFYYSWLRTASPKNTNDAIWASVMQYVNNAYNYHGAASRPARWA
jgi:ABC-type transport system substrate-binding protein